MSETNPNPENPETTLLSLETPAAVSLITSLQGAYKGNNFSGERDEDPPMKSWADVVDDDKTDDDSESDEEHEEEECEKESMGVEEWIAKVDESMASLTSPALLQNFLEKLDTNPDKEKIMHILLCHMGFSSSLEGDSVILNKVLTFDSITPAMVGWQLRNPRTNLVNLVTYVTKLASRALESEEVVFWDSLGVELKKAVPDRHLLSKIGTLLSDGQLRKAFYFLEGYKFHSDQNYLRMTTETISRMNSSVHALTAQVDAATEAVIFNGEKLVPVMKQVEKISSHVVGFLSDVEQSVLQLEELRLKFAGLGRVSDFPASSGTSDTPCLEDQWKRVEIIDQDGTYKCHEGELIVKGGAVTTTTISVITKHKPSLEKFELVDYTILMRAGPSNVLKLCLPGSSSVVHKKMIRMYEQGVITLTEPLYYHEE